MHIAIWRVSDFEIDCVCVCACVNGDVFECVCVCVWGFIYLPTGFGCDLGSFFSLTAILATDAALEDCN